MEEKTFEYRHPRPSVTTDCVIFSYSDDHMNVLLVERGDEPFKGHWAFPGGFLEMDETAETCAKRELMEETGLQVDNLEQLHTFSDIDRDPRGRTITIAYYAVIDDMLPVKGGDDAAKAQWFSINELPPLAFDHEKILSVALSAVHDDMTVKAARRYLQLQEEGAGI